MFPGDIPCESPPPFPQETLFHVVPSHQNCSLKIDMVWGSHGKECCMA